MELKKIFAFKAVENPKNLAHFETILQFAKTVPPVFWPFFYKKGIRIHVVGALTPEFGVAARTYPDGRTAPELPALFSSNLKILFLPLAQKAPDFPVWFDCYDFTDPKRLAAKGEPIPPYMQKMPHIRTEQYRQYLVLHETGHIFDRLKGLRMKRKYLAAYKTDMEELRRKNTPLNWQLSFCLTTEYGGFSKEPVDGLREVLADCFVEMTEPSLRHVDIPLHFANVFALYQKDYKRSLWWHSFPNLGSFKKWLPRIMRQPPHSTHSKI